MAGPEVRIEPAGGLPDGGLGTDEDRVRAAIRAADQGEGVVILGDLGSAIDGLNGAALRRYLTIRYCRIHFDSVD